jgi:hypothetical protein
VRGRAAVLDAVARPELEQVLVELQPDAPGEDVEDLLGVAVPVRLLAGRAARLELGDDDLDVAEGLRRQERLAAELAPGDELARVAAEDERPAGVVGGEEVGDRDAERLGDPLQRGDARARPPALGLAEEALREAGPLGDVAERQPAQLADRADPLADVRLRLRLGGDDRLGQPGLLKAAEAMLKSSSARPYARRSGPVNGTPVRQAV